VGSWFWAAATPRGRWGRVGRRRLSVSLGRTLAADTHQEKTLGLVAADVVHVDTAMSGVENFWISPVACGVVDISIRPSIRGRTTWPSARSPAGSDVLLGELHPAPFCHSVTRVARAALVGRRPGQVAVVGSSCRLPGRPSLAPASKRSAAVDFIDRRARVMMPSICCRPAWPCRPVGGEVYRRRVAASSTAGSPPSEVRPAVLDVLAVNSVWISLASHMPAGARGRGPVATDDVLVERLARVRSRPCRSGYALRPVARAWGYHRRVAS